MALWLPVVLVVAFVVGGLAVQVYFGWVRPVIRFRSAMRDRRQSLSPSNRALIALRSVDPCRVGLVEADDVYAATAESIASGVSPGMDADAAEAVVRRALGAARCEQEPSRSAVRRVARLCLPGE